MSKSADDHRQEILGRVLLDKAFRDRLLAPGKAKETLEAENYKYTPELLKAIEQARTQDVDALVKEFHQRSGPGGSALDDGGGNGGGGPIGGGSS